MCLPIIANFVNVDNVVRLSNGNFSRIRREGHALDHVAFLAIFGVDGLGRKFVDLLPTFVEEDDHPVRGAHGKSFVVRSPTQGSDLRCSILIHNNRNF